MRWCGTMLPHHRITYNGVGFIEFRCCSLKHSFRLQHRYHSNPTTPNLQHTWNQENYDQCGNSTEKSQAPDDGYINVRNMLST